MRYADQCADGVTIKASGSSIKEVEKNLSKGVDIVFAESQKLPSPVAWRRQKNEVDWKALDAAQRKLFPPLPPDATDDEIARRNAAITEWSQRPGRQVVIATGRDADGRKVTRERFIAHDDYAQFAKPAASLSARSSGSDLRSARPKTTTKKISVKQPEAVAEQKAERQPEAGALPSSAQIPATLLPEIENLRWEWKKGGTFVEAWHCQAGTRGRSNSTYLGRIGRKQIEGFQTWSASEVAHFVTKWVQSKRDEKSIG